MVDLKFVDLLGTWQHCTFPLDFLDENALTEGLGSDGSSIRGWRMICPSDMLAVPDLSTAVLDPFFARPTVSLIADIMDPLSREEYTRDPRNIARKADRNMKKTGIADTAYSGPEPEFFIFDEVRYEQNQHTGMYAIASVEGAWNTARFEEPNLGYKPSFKGGYFPVSPTDTQQDLRTEMVGEMREVGIVVEMIELEDHPWFVAVQFHPEFQSKPLAPHPLFRGFIGAALEYSRFRPAPAHAAV